MRYNPFILLQLFCWGGLMMACQPTPVIEKFSGKNIPRGNKGKLTWVVGKVDKLYLIDHQQNDQTIPLEPGQSSYEIKPEQDYRYTLVAEKKGKQYEKTVSGKVLKNPPYIVFFRGATQYTVGQATPAYLEWKINNAEMVYLHKVAENLPHETRVEVAPDTSQYYELVAIGKYGDTVRASHKMEVTRYKSKISFRNFRKESLLVAGIDNVLEWDFPGASWVMVKGKRDTLAAQDQLLIKPERGETQGLLKLLVKYPNEKYPLEEIIRVGIIPIRMEFRPSKLRAGLEEPITLSWQVEGGKDIQLRVGNQVLPQQAAVGKYIFTPNTDTEVVLEAKDVFGEEHQINWTIKCAARRPFIKNAIDYQQFKDFQRQHAVRRPRLLTEIFEVNRDNYPKQVQLKVLVTDTLGNFIRGLAPPTLAEAESKKFFLNIIETIQGQAFAIQNFRVREINQITSKPYDIALCLDYSGSMTGAILQLEKNIRRFINQKDALDRYSIIKFDDELKTVSRMEISENKLLDLPWNGLKGFGGATALYAGIDEALESFVQDSTERQKIMFVFTDGAENSSFQHFETRLYTPLDVVRKARKLGIKVFPISFGEGTNQAVLEAVGRLTDGRSFNIYDNSEIDSVYTELPRIFRNYYEITYTPPRDASLTKEGKTIITLQYNDQTKTARSTTYYQTHENFDLDEVAGYVPGTVPTGRRNLTPPQAVAFFDFDRFQLKPRYTPSIEAIAKFLLNRPQAQIDILGHTDLVGTPEDNLLLSRQRAEEIRRFLQAKGIAAQRLHIVPMGEQKPVWPIESQEWQAQENRRIEIVIWE
ncbi:MAG: VWA domain-containing protein [Microscillaceae bacterium]|nr:VWA domain-containing protein [Microscillaceae bacterium]